MLLIPGITMLRHIICRANTSLPLAEEVWPNGKFNYPTDIFVDKEGNYLYCGFDELQAPDI